MRGIVIYEKQFPRREAAHPEVKLLGGAEFETRALALVLLRAN